MTPTFSFWRKASVWMMRIGALLLVGALAKTYLASSMDITSAKKPCIIECQRSNAFEQAASKVCFAHPQKEQPACFLLDEIIMVKSYNKQSVVYDYRGKGTYVKENLRTIEQDIKQANRSYYYLYRANRQEIVNLRYTQTFNSCDRILKLEEDFVSTVSRDKVREVEQLLYKTCSIIGR
ncbi:MAG: LytTR family transcriptional regulator DNA-binding domain-containing protein [Bacteroidota bacterium]